VHAIQIEINRGLYIDEASLVPTAGFNHLREDLLSLAGQIFSEMPRLMERRAAAE
jgi:N-formylglutamate amidohydrolase